MRMKFLFLQMFIMLLIGTVSVRLLSSELKNRNYDRVYLESMMNRYLTSLVTHNPSSLPLTPHIKYTENGQRLKLGDGMWGPVSGLGTYKLYFADTVTGQIGYFGVLEENGHPAVVAIRLKIEDQLISEIETIIARKAQDSWVKPDSLVDKPIFREALTASERRIRKEMITIANSYFEGLEQATGKITPFDSNCTRIENGNITANNPNGENPINKMTAGEQFNTGFSKFITKIRERRFPIIDEERGLVYAIIFFDHAGTVKTVKMTDGTMLTVQPPYDTPYTFLIGELFKIKNGLITRIEAVLLSVPYGMPSGWEQKNE